MKKQKYRFHGNNELDTGTNIINITVTAEDGTTGEYMVKVHRLSKTISEQNITPNIPSAAETSEEINNGDSNEMTNTENNIDGNTADENTTNESADNEVSTTLDELSNETEGVEITNINAKSSNFSPKIIIIVVVAAIIIVLFIILTRLNKRKSRHLK